MAYQDNRGSSGNFKKSTFSNANNKPQKKTTEEVAKEVIAENFSGLANDLLSLNDVTKIKSILTHLEKFIQKVANGISTSQLRNVYGKIIEQKTVIELQLIRPNIAYVAARNDKREAKQVMAFIDYLIQQVDTDEKLKAFNKIMEAIVAYHKYSNTKN